MTSQDWMSIREASLALGVSELTIRRRIKSGRVAHRIENGKYFVNFSVAPQPAAEPIAPSAPSFSAAPPEVQASGDAALDTPALAVLLPELGRLAERAGQATALTEQVRQLEEERRSLQESLVVLAGRNGWLESRLEEREHELKMLEDSRPRRSFWRRLFGRSGE